MKRVDFTGVAERELEEILQYISQKYPGIYSSFENRLHAIVSRIGTWPESAPEVTERRAFAVCRSSGIRTKCFIAFWPIESKC